MNPDGLVIATTTYGRGIDEILFRNNYGSAQYFLQDRNNNTMAVAGGDGKILESYRYDAFGAPTFFDQDGYGIETTMINNRFLFTGREYAKEGKFGFYEYRARAYHPVLGRFLSEDPVGFQIAGTKPSVALHAMFPSISETFTNSEVNLYRYCANDPLDKSDPTGLYVTYSGDWSAADAEKFKQAFKQQWGTAEGRAAWESRYNSKNEFRVSPDRSTGSAKNGASNFNIQEFGSRSFLQSIGEALRRDANALMGAIKGPGDSSGPRRDAASEQTARDMAKQIERDLGPAARREFHDAKQSGAGDRTMQELREDARAIYEKYGRTPPAWIAN